MIHEFTKNSVVSSRNAILISLLVNRILKISQSYEAIHILSVFRQQKTSVILRPQKTNVILQEERSHYEPRNFAQIKLNHNYRISN